MPPLSDDQNLTPKAKLYRQAFRRCLLDTGVDGQVVLSVLAEECSAYASTYDDTVPADARHDFNMMNVGARRLWLLLNDYMGLTPSEVSDLVQGGRQVEANVE